MTITGFVPVQNLWPDGDFMQSSLMKNYIIKILCVESAIFMLSIFLLCGCAPAYAADLSTEPMDGAASSAAGWGFPASEESSAPDVEDASQKDSSALVGENVSQEDSSAPDVEDVSQHDESSQADSDIIVDPAPVEVEPDTYNESEDVVVNRAELESLISLVNDLSGQLALYAADIPAVYQPTEEDYAYRADLLETLSGIRESLQILSEPAPVEPEMVEEETIPEEETASESVSDASADVSALADSSAPAETDPADTETDPADTSASGDISAPSEISQQDFYKLVLGFLFLVCLWPVLTWIYRFLSSFIPV